MTSLLCLASDKGLHSLEAALDVDKDIFVCFTNTSGSQATQLIQLANENNIPSISWDSIKNNLSAFVRDNNVDGILCVGWPFMIRGEVEKITYVLHDSLLPKLRGFNPLVTAMLDRHEFTGVTLVTAEAECDTGKILWSKSTPIFENDTIGKLTDRIVQLCAEGTQIWLTGQYAGCKEQVGIPTYSIWRDASDYRIDWNKSSEDIDLHIRAHGYPYGGAKTYMGGMYLTIKKSEIYPDVNFTIRDPGKIWKLENGMPVVVCGEGMVKLTEIEKGAENFLPMKSVRKRFL